jgi:PIN domain nuclease of toxin-antitoxin system
MIHLDTHVVVWFYQGNRQKLLPVWPLLENEELAISPMVVLELEFLFEVGKTDEGASAVVEALEKIYDIRISDVPFSKAIGYARTLSWTRDPFDRIIIGHAMAEDVRLLTKDTHILRHFHKAIWKAEI